MACFIVDEGVIGMLPRIPKRMCNQSVILHVPSGVEDNYGKQQTEDKTVNKEHEEIFSILQKYVKLNLVVPIGEEHMYYAAIHNKACKLTVQGQHYWELVKNNKI